MILCWVKFFWSPHSTQSHLLADPEFGDTLPLLRRKWSSCDSLKIVCFWLKDVIYLKLSMTFRVEQSGFDYKNIRKVRMKYCVKWQFLYGKIFPRMKLSTIVNEKEKILRQSSYPNCFTRISTLQFTKYGKQAHFVENEKRSFFHACIHKFTHRSCSIIICTSMYVHIST